MYQTLYYFITCLPSGMNDDVSAFCGGVISINTWEDELSIPVMATTDLVYDGDVTRQLNVGIFTHCEEVVTYNYTHSSVLVI